MENVNYYKKKIEVGEKDTIPVPKSNIPKSSPYNVITEIIDNTGIENPRTKVSKIKNPSQFEED